ncbi:unnamed protein product, partial [Brenthis ino]
MIVTGWWWAGACVGGAVLLCAAGALARPHLRRRTAAAAAANPVCYSSFDINNVRYVRLSSTAQSLSNANRLVSRADKRVIAYYYNYRCAYINEAVAAIESRIHVCPLYVHMCRATITGATHTRTAGIARRAFDAHTNATRQIVRVCAATSGQPVHRHPHVLPATRLRTPRRGAARPRPRH